MLQQHGIRRSWRGTNSFEDAKPLIDYGVMLRWSEMRTLKRNISLDDQQKIAAHFAVRLAERADDRLQSEIIIESLLIWLTNIKDESVLNSFLESMFQQSRSESACWTLVEIALSNEVTETTHDQEIFAMAVTLACELGINIKELEKQLPGEFKNASSVLDHIATYLLSVSNTNNNAIRLSLLHYFGSTEHGPKPKVYVNRIMLRFGHTVLEHLFTCLLYKKRSEAIAIQYLLENLPYIFGGDSHAQKIVHETFKFYMFKQPERFSLFIQTLADHLESIEDSSFDVAKEVYLQHLGALLKVVSDVNHRQLGRDILLAISKFEGHSHYELLVKQILAQTEIRKPFKELLMKLRDGADCNDVIESAAQFRSSKRGRKPSFARTDPVATMHQVAYLGNIEIQRAS